MDQKTSNEALEKKIASLTRENRELGLMLKERDSFGTNLLAKAPKPVKKADLANLVRKLLGEAKTPV